MRHHIHTHSTSERMTEKDWADRDAQYLADDAEAFRRNYSTVTPRQAEDLERALDVILGLLGYSHNRKMQ